MKIISVNTNGLNTNKIEKLAWLAQKFNVDCLFIQEFKRAKIPLDFLAAFSEETWDYRVTAFQPGNNVQGLCSLIRINENVEISSHERSDPERGILQHNFKLSNGTESVTLANVYWPPSATISSEDFENLSSFDMTLGDININTSNRESLLNNFCESHDRVNLVDFSTFMPHNSTVRSSTLTDAVITRPSIATDVVDLGILGDHAILKVACSVDLIGDKNRNCQKRSHHHFDFSKLDSNVKTKLWNELPARPSYSDIQNLKRNFFEICRARHPAKKTNTKVNLEFTPDCNMDASSEGNTSLSTFWENATESLNEMKNLGEVFRTIKVFRKGQIAEIKPDTVYSRRDTNKSLKKFKSKVCKAERLSKDDFYKYQRTLRKISKI